ncbi:AtpZ/AtpI family protein [Novosphingobium sp. M1R2S20]|uniref:ATP synthase protein I n=1 Tax=Novosphingobium rhizovicinum TaxID=3228928 RepID=A0ABV3RDU0_9SPHN
MNDDADARDPVGEDARVDALNERLRAAREREEARTKVASNAESDDSYRAGNRVLADLLGGIVGGVFLGWVIDHFAGTAPWGLLVMMFLGIIVAFRNIIRMSNRRSD